MLSAPRRLLTAAAELLLLFPVAYLLFCNVPWWRALPAPAKIPAPKMPAPNAYDDYARAARAIVEPRRMDEAAPRSRPGTALIDPTYSIAPRSEVSELVARNERPIRILTAALEKPYRYPPIRSIKTPYPHLADCRRLARLLAASAEMSAFRGRHREAAQIALRGVRFGEQIKGGAPCLPLLVGVACKTIARRQLWPLVAGADAATAREAARAMDDLISSSVPLWDSLQEEKWFGQAAILSFMDNPDVAEVKGKGSPASPTSIGMAQLVGRVSLRSYTLYMDQLIADSHLRYPQRSRTPRELSGRFELMAATLAPAADMVLCVGCRELAADELLATALALRAYRVERGSYPPSLAALVPRYLSRVYDDPFAAEGPLRYRRAGATYQLYSVGPDGRDDDCWPISIRPRRGAVPESRGDMVAGIN